MRPAIMKSTVIMGLSFFNWQMGTDIFKFGTGKAEKFGFKLSIELHHHQ